AVPSIIGSYWTTFFPAVVVLGLGMATSVAPLTTTVMNSVDAKQAGTASGINNAVSRVAAVLAIAVFGTVVLGTFNRAFAERLSVLNLTPELKQHLEDQRIKLAAIQIPGSVDIRSRDAIKQAIDESFVAGFRLVMLIASALALASAACSWFIIGS